MLRCFVKLCSGPIGSKAKAGAKLAVAHLYTHLRGQVPRFRVHVRSVDLSVGIQTHGLLFNGLCAVCFAAAG